MLIDPGRNVTLQSAVVPKAAPTVRLPTPPNRSIFIRRLADCGSRLRRYLRFQALRATEPRHRLNISFSGGQVALSFQTRTELTYTLQYKNALSDMVWQNLLPAINGDGNTHSVNQPASEVSRFYRLSVQ